MPRPLPESRRVLPLLAAALLAVAPVLGQVPDPQTPPAPTATAHDPGPQVPAAFASARATMRTFLGAFYADGGPQLETAASCLDLTALPPELRSVRGRELAVQLKNVLDRTRLVELDRLPAETRGPSFVFLRMPEGEVVISPQSDGRWLFSADTVASVDALARATAGREVVEGVERLAPEVVSPATWLRRRVPAALHEQVLFLETWQWIGLLVVLVLGVVVNRTLVWSGRGALDRLMRRRALTIEPKLLNRVMRPGGVLAMVVLWGVGIAWLGLPVEVLRVYLNAVRLVAILAAVMTAYRSVDVVAAVLERRAARTASRFDDLLVPLLRKSLKVFVVAVGLVFVASNLRLDVTSLLASLGLGGLAVALAAKDTLSNLFGSLTVVLDRPFQVGDWVVIGNVEGTVEELGFRSTRIRTFYNSLVTLPNTNLIAASVDNLGARAYRRWKTTLGIAYDTPGERVDAFCEGIRELVRRHPYTRKDYYHVVLNDFGESSLNILLYVFFRTPDWATELRERHRLGVDILRLARELGVEFAFPTRTLYLRQEEWSAPTPAGEDYPGATSSLSASARARAAALVDGALGGEVPPPVSFGVPSEENRGDSGE